MNHRYEITSGKAHENLILETRPRWGMKHVTRGFYVLPKVDDTKIFMLNFKTARGDTSLIFRQNSGYFIAAENKDGDLYVFNEAKEYFQKALKSKDYVVGRDHGMIMRLADEKKIDLPVNYQLIKKFADPAHTEIGGAAFKKALEMFATLNGKEDKKTLAKHSVVIMQMIPETLRFDSMLDYVKKVYSIGASPMQTLIDAQNDWNSLCKVMLEEGKIGPLTKEENDIILLKALVEEKMKKMKKGPTFLRFKGHMY